LLGLVRDGGFIAHDSDVDFGVSRDTDMGEVCDILIPLGYDFQHITGTDAIGQHMALHRFDICVDFFKMMRTPSNRFEFAVWSSGTERTLLSVSSFETLRFQTNGFDVPVPDLFERHLSEMYGDWRVVDKKWCPNRSPAFVSARRIPGTCRFIAPTKGDIQ
jgi:phosphorylcholine metabolism protein LicD